MLYEKDDVIKILDKYRTIERFAKESRETNQSNYKLYQSRAENVMSMVGDFRQKIPGEILKECPNLEKDLLILEREFLRLKRANIYHQTYKRNSGLGI